MVEQCQKLISFFGQKIEKRQGTFLSNAIQQVESTSLLCAVAMWIP